MIKAPTPNTRFIVTVPGNLHKDLKAHAQKYQVPMAELTRIALSYYLDQLDKPEPEQLTIHDFLGGGDNE